MNAAPTTPAPANDAQRGSHWQQRMVGRHSWCVLHHADCRDVLPIACDALITDPPYGGGYAADPPPVMTREGRKVNHAPSEWDDTPAENVLTLPSLAPLVVIWGGNYYALPPRRGWLVWQKPDRPPSMADAEMAWVSRDMNTRILPWTIAATNAERVGHPTQKPVRVMAWAMEQIGVPKGATVLDPYMGSGTTAIACIRLGMNFIGIERDAAHYKTACDRIAHELDGALL
jgi:site-specific DNA-methyltransferase (adenine-specific)